MSEAALDHVPRTILWVLRLGAVVALAAAVVGTVTTGEVSRAAGGVAVVALVAAPLLRVALLSEHWLRLRDLRFAAAALGLLAVAAGGALLALWLS